MQERSRKRRNGGRSEGRYKAKPEDDGFAQVLGANESTSTGIWTDSSITLKAR